MNDSINFSVCSHIATCLPDYWGGHHLPHLCFPVRKGMDLNDVKEALLQEVVEGAWGGNLTYEDMQSELLESRAIEVIERGFSRWRLI